MAAELVRTTAKLDMSHCKLQVCYQTVSHIYVHTTQNMSLFHTMFVSPAPLSHTANLNSYDVLPPPQISHTHDVVTTFSEHPHALLPSYMYMYAYINLSTHISTQLLSPHAFSPDR